MLCKVWLKESCLVIHRDNALAILIPNQLDRVGSDRLLHKGLQGTESSDLGLPQLLLDMAKTPICVANKA